MAKKETDKARKARLESERVARRGTPKKSADRKLKSRKTGEVVLQSESIEAAVSKGAARARKAAAQKPPVEKKPETKPAKKPAKKSAKKAQAVPGNTSIASAQLKDIIPVSNPEFKKSQEERALAEIGRESTPAEKDRRAKEIAEIPFSSPVENPYVEPSRSETPKMTPLPLPTPSQEARRALEGAPSARSGTGPYTFNNPTRPPMRGPNVAKRSARRTKAGLYGHPGDEPVEGSSGSVNSLAVKLAKRDHALAKESGKPVNGITPEDMTPTNESIQGKHHQRLAHLLMNGVEEKDIAKLGSGTGHTMETKVSHLFETLKQHKAKADVQPVDLEAEGITHIIHPTTKEAIPVSKLSAQERASITRTNGKPSLVSQDPTTGEWRLEANTGNRQADQTLGWNPDEAIGWVQADSHPRGTKSLVFNMPPQGRRMRTLWEHHLITMKSDFPAQVEGESRSRQSTTATKMVTYAGKEIPTEDLDKLETINKTASPKMGLPKSFLRSSGRTTRRFKGTAEGVVEPDIREVTSRARVINPESANAAELGGKVQPKEGGSTRITETAEIPVVEKVVSYRKPDKQPKKTRLDPTTGEVIIRPYQRGMTRETVAPATMPRKQRADLVDNSGLLSRINAESVARKFIPRDIESETDRSPIVNPPRRLKMVEEVVPKGKKGVKKVRKAVYEPLMSDQPIPGFESYGEIPKVPEVKPEKKELPPLFTAVEGPITSQQFAKRVKEGVETPVKGSYKAWREGELKDVDLPMLPDSSDVSLAKRFGPTSERVIVPTAHLEKVARENFEANRTKVRDVAKIPGNSPVEVPREEPVASKPKKPKKVKQPIQLSLPGMEERGLKPHQAGVQWIQAAGMSKATKALQNKASNKGVPGSGAVPQIRGVSPKKSTKSFKKR